MRLSAAIYNGKSEIRNIIFDWGGVITNLHPEITMKAFEKLGLTINNESGLYDQVFIPFEIGVISPEEFRNRIRKYIPISLTDKMIDDAWNSILGELPAERWNLLEKVSKYYQTFLLSNTNLIHRQYYFGYLQKIYGIYGYIHLFKKVYFSYELHLRKPNKEIFEFVLNDSGINPQETLFIDDFIENIETASQLGIQTIHLKGPLTLLDLFEINPGSLSV